MAPLAEYRGPSSDARKGQGRAQPRRWLILFVHAQRAQKTARIARRKTRSIVLHEAIHRVANGLGPNQYLGVRRRVFQGVVEKIDQHAFKQRGINLQQRQIAGKLSAHFTLRECRTKSGKRTPNDLVEGMPLLVQPNAGALHSGKVQQICDQPLQFLSLVADG